MLKGRPYSEYEHYVHQAKGLDIGVSYHNRHKSMIFSIAINKCKLDKLPIIIFMYVNSSVLF